MSEWIERSTAGHLHDLMTQTQQPEGTSLVPAERGPKGG
jgi:hypothetical protein